MGYYMNQRDSIFTIKAENKEAALEAVKALATKDNRFTNAGRIASVNGREVKVRCYSWVNDNYIDAKTLKEAVSCWRWCLEEDNTGDVIGIYFEGEKLGNDEVLFEALAPFVESDSYIEMSGEEAALWRWSFERGELVERNATITWE